MYVVKLLLIIAALYLIVQLLYSGYFFAIARTLSKKVYVGNSTLGQGREFKMLAIGDSIGAGVGASSFETSVVGRIAGTLAKDRKIRLSNRSVSGYTFNDLLNLEPPSEKQDLILIIAGSNDLFHFGNLKSFRESVQKVFKMYSPKAIKVIVVGPGRVFDAEAIPLFLKPIYKSMAHKYATIINEEAKKFDNVKHVNPIAAMKLEQTYGKTGASDNFHPNDEGHRFWFDLVKGSL